MRERLQCRPSLITNVQNKGKSLIFTMVISTPDFPAASWLTRFITRMLTEPCDDQAGEATLSRDEPIGDETAFSHVFSPHVRVHCPTLRFVRDGRTVKLTR